MGISSDRIAVGWWKKLYTDEVWGVFSIGEVEIFLVENKMQKLPTWSTSPSLGKRIDKIRIWRKPSHFG